MKLTVSVNLLVCFYDVCFVFNWLHFDANDNRSSAWEQIRPSLSSWMEAVFGYEAVLANIKNSSKQIPTQTSPNHISLMHRSYVMKYKVHFFLDLFMM